MADNLIITSCSITPVTPPVAAEPFMDEGNMLFQGENFTVGGSVGMGPPPSSLREVVIPRVLAYPIRVGWRAGWIQLCSQDEIWAIYRGAASADGSLLAKWTVCDTFDTKSTDNSELWVQMADKFLVYLSASKTTGLLEFKDVPHQYFEPSLTNRITGRKNILAVAVVRMSFILALAAKDPEDNLHLMKHMTWKLQWECNFRGPADALEVLPVAHKTKAEQGNPLDKAPQKLIQALKNPSHVSSNMRAQEYEVTPYPNWQGLAYLRPLPRRT